ncbi:DUF1232 domain-containing protein [Bacillus sp. 1P10SD]|uniref:YkvA family protein n=1 Tax=Bacillus sp. 1P10SD TaxID=3132265 RepID=UPI0039A51AEE
MKKLSKKTKWFIAVTILYLVFPQDIIPDYIIGLGQIDDIALIGLTIKSIKDDLKRNQK